MYYIFVINGRKDKYDVIMADLRKQMEGLKMPPYEIYRTEGVGDGTRFVRIYCDLHQKEEVCFVACGGSGTANEVASGIIGFENKSMAIMAYGSTNDFTKQYYTRDFTSLKRMLNGERHHIDVIRTNDSYSINVINIGFDASVAYLAQKYLDDGMNGVRAFRKGLRDSLLTHRFNSIRISADGERLNRKRIMMCSIGNGSWCGGQYKCSPRAVTDDGLMEVCMIKPTTLLTFLMMLPIYTAGKHLDSEFCMKRMIYRQSKHVELDSKNLIYISNDGEIYAATHFDIDILPRAITLQLPVKDEVYL